jgi:hypothetical protein
MRYPVEEMPLEAPLVYIYFNADEEPAFICMFCDWDIDEGDRKGLEFFHWAKAHNLMHRQEFDALGEEGIDPVQRCYLIWQRHRGVSENEE